MYPLRLFLLLAVSLLLCLPPAEAQRKKKPATKKNSVMELDQEPSKSDRMLAEEALIEGMKFFVLEEFDKAIKNFEESLEIDPNNAAAYFQIARAQRREEKPELALKAAEKALERDAENPYYYTFLANLQQESGAINEAVETYERLLKEVEQKPEYYEELAILHMQRGDYDEAIRTYDTVEKKYGESIELMRRRQLIYLQQDKLNKAIAEGEKIMERFPDRAAYAIQQAEILLQANRKDEASALLNELLEREPGLPEAHLLMAQIYQEEGKAEAQHESLRRAFSSPDLDLNAKLEILMRYYQGMRRDPRYQQVGIELSRLTIKAHPKTAKAHSVLGDFLLAGGNFTEARDSYLSALERDGNNYDLWERVIQLDMNESDYAGAAQHANKALELFPNQAMLWFYAGSAHYLEKSYKEAEFSLQQGLMLAAEDGLKSQISSQLGDVYNALQEYKKSDAAYEDALKFDPDNAHAKNNYSYFLSLRQEKLKRAAELSASLVERYPENPTYLDTHGWVLYQRGDYKEAAVYLKKAVAGAPQDGTVLEHYADVLFRLNEKEEALKLWKRAKELGGDLSPEIDKKIQRGEL